LNHVKSPLITILLTTLLAVSGLFAGSLDDLDSQFFTSQTTMGGYGELHYNQVMPADGATTGILDFHRFVLFFSHSWTEKWSFKSELELEHNFVKNGQGELELEQAFVDYHHSDAIGIQVGVLLPSVGFLNEYHEPPLFFGVERPDYAKSIIPTTWFGNGAALYGQAMGLDYRLTVMEGLDGTKFSSSSALRNGRQKGYKAEATRPLVNFRLETRALEGLILGGSVSHTAALDTLNDEDRTNPTTLFELHADLQRAGLILRGEYGQISYGTPELVSDIKLARGYYVDLGYDLASILSYEGELIPWFRYSDINTAASTETGDTALEAAHHVSQWLVGLQVKPIPQVVYKLDYGKLSPETGSESTVFNLGVGYMF